MIGRVVRRVPVPVPRNLHLKRVAALAGLAASLLLVSLPTGVAAAALTPWPAATTPALTLDTLAGDRIDLADLDDGVVIVHFFATWCEPCRPELAALDRMAQSFEGRQLTILAVDSGEPEARIRRFFGEVPVSYPVLLDGDRAALKAWDVATFPTTFIVGDAGQPLMIAEGEVAWDGDTVVAVIADLLDGRGNPPARPPTQFETPRTHQGEVR